MGVGEEKKKRAKFCGSGGGGPEEGRDLLWPISTLAFFLLRFGAVGRGGEGREGRVRRGSGGGGHFGSRPFWLKAGCGVLFLSIS